MGDKVLQIKRGTTPTIIVNVPKEQVDISQARNLWFSISQCGATSEPIIKRETDTINVDVENNRVWVLLTQQETLRLIPTVKSVGYQNNLTTDMELSVLLDNGVRTISKKVSITILQSIREGIMYGADLNVTEPIEEPLVIDAEFDTVTNLAPMNYNDLQGKPQINGVKLEGNLTNEDLGINAPLVISATIDALTTYEELTIDKGFEEIWEAISNYQAVYFNLTYDETNPSQTVTKRISISTCVLSEEENERNFTITFDWFDIGKRNLYQINISAGKSSDGESDWSEAYVIADAYGQGE